MIIHEYYSLQQAKTSLPTKFVIFYFRPSSSNVFLPYQNKLLLNNQINSSENLNRPHWDIFINCNLFPSSSSRAQFTKILHFNLPQLDVHSLLSEIN